MACWRLKSMPRIMGRLTVSETKQMWRNSLPAMVKVTLVRPMIPMGLPQALTTDGKLNESSLGAPNWWWMVDDMRLIPAPVSNKALMVDPSISTGNTVPAVVPGDRAKTCFGGVGAGRYWLGSYRHWRQASISTTWMSNISWTSFTSRLCVCANISALSMVLSCSVKSKLATAPR